MVHKRSSLKEVSRKTNYIHIKDKFNIKDWLKRIIQINFRTENESIRFTSKV